MKIRPAIATDAAAIADIWNPVIRDTSITFTTAVKPVAVIENSITDSKGAFLVATHGGEVKGFATYGPFRGGPGYRHTKEHTIMLSQNAQGQGIGRALMAHLCDHARIENIHSLIAGISGENDKAIEFHRVMGFAEIARLPEVGHKFGRWMDLVLMQKIL